jgi:hypothetical protein
LVLTDGVQDIPHALLSVLITSQRRIDVLARPALFLLGFFPDYPLRFLLAVLAASALDCICRNWPLLSNCAPSCGVPWPKVDRALDHVDSKPSSTPNLAPLQTWIKQSLWSAQGRPERQFAGFVRAVKRQR